MIILLILVEGFRVRSASPALVNAVCYRGKGEKGLQLYGGERNMLERDQGSCAPRAFRCGALWGGGGLQASRVVTRAGRVSVSTRVS